MRIPQYFAQERMEVSQLPRGPGLPRAPARLLADTGKIEEAQALAGFGGALGKIAGMLAEIQAEKQRGRDEAALAKLSDQERDFVFGAHNALEQYVAEDIKDFPELEEDFAKDWDRKIKELVKGRNRQVAEHFQVWADQNRAKILQGYHNKVWRKEQSFGQGQAISIANKNLIRGDLQGALRTYEQHAQYFSPEELQGLKDEAPHALDWYAGIWWAENNPEWLLVQLKDEEKYYTTLNPVEKQQLKRQAQSKLNTTRIAADRQQTELQKNMRKEATDLMVADELTYRWLQANKEEIADDDYERFSKYLMGLKITEEKKIAEVQRVKKQGDLISEISDMLDMLQIEDRGDPVEIKKKLDELRALGPEAKEDYEQYRGKLSSILTTREDLKSPLNTPIAKRGMAVLNDMQKLELDSKEDEYADDPDQEIRHRNKWFRKKNAYDRWLLKEERSEDEIEKYIEKVTYRPREEIVLGRFSKFWRYKKRHFWGREWNWRTFGILLPEEEALVEKKVDALKKEDLWKTLTEAEKSSARKRFERGETVDDIVKRLLK